MADTPSVDRSAQSLVLYKKDGTKVTTGDKGASAVTLTGLAAGTKAAAGDYQTSFTDGTNESSKVDVPAFNVPDIAAHQAPTNVKATATADGATITADKVDDGYNLCVLDSSDKTKVLFTGKANSVTITGLAQATAVEAGKYVVAWVNSDTSYQSPTADVPAFSTPPAAPTDVAAAATADGATITAK